MKKFTNRVLNRSILICAVSIFLLALIRSRVGSNVVINIINEFFYVTLFISSIIMISRTLKAGKKGFKNVNEFSLSLVLYLVIIIKCISGYIFMFMIMAKITNETLIYATLDVGRYCDYTLVAWVVWMVISKVASAPSTSSHTLLSSTEKSRPINSSNPLLSLDDRTRNSAINTVMNQAARKDIRSKIAVEEALTVLGASKDAIYYTPTYGRNFSASIDECKDELIKLARLEKLLDDPARSQALIIKTAIINHSIAQDIMHCSPSSFLSYVLLGVHMQVSVQLNK